MITIDFLTVFNQILILFLLLLVGFTIKKLKVVNDHFSNSLSSFIIYVSLPALIINSMDSDFNQEQLSKVLNIFVIGLGVYLLMILISYLVVYFIPATTEEKGVYKFSLIFANVSFVGYPVVNLLFGKEGIFLVTISNLWYKVFVWTLGIIIIGSNAKRNKKLSWDKLLNPGMFSVIIGLILFILPIKLPYSITTTLAMLGSTSTPLSMIVVGCILSEVKVSNIFSNWRLWTITLVRLVITPLIVLSVLKVVPNINLIVFNISVILAGMPAAANTAIFAQKFGGDAVLGSEAIFLTTLASLVTIPLLVYTLGNL